MAQLSSAPVTPLRRVEEALRVGILWVRTHQEQFWGIVGVSVLAVAMTILTLRHRAEETENAWTAMGPAQSQVMQGQLDNAKKTLADWSARYAATPAASYEQFLQADLQYKTSDYVNASATYAALADHGNPAVLRPLALSGEAASEEMAGHVPAALALAKQFVDTYPDHFLTGTMILSEARLNELTGNAAAASALYDRYTLLYPQTPAVAFAKARLQALSSHLPAAPAPSPSALLPPAK